MKIYIAGPLFSEGERRFNEALDELIRSCGHETYLPQRDGGIIALMPDTVEGMPKEQYVYRKDLENLRGCDIFLLVMDGRVPDEGACVALGYCTALGKRCVGYKTDVRGAWDGQDNLMLTCSLERILRSGQELEDFLNRIRPF